MTPEAQRIAIAEACGWVRLECPSGPFWHHGQFGQRRSEELPFLSDLNAMHEAEKTLVEDRVWDYVDLLFSVVNHIPYDNGLCSRKTLLPLLHATAAQRAEAFLRTLGKWDDSK